jgi:NAD(P)-dependent dehydrogenase (short-subunit alcohol dehydrogenase family)
MLSPPRDPSPTTPQRTRPVVLVTGAAQRIGRAIALELAAHGFDVALHCHNASLQAASTLSEARALGSDAALFNADLATDQCQALVPAVAAHFGRVDAVVNNASLFQYDSATDTRLETQQRHWAVNTAAPIALAQALAVHLAQRGAQGCVVNLLDQKLWNPNPDYFSYTLSKAGLQAATVMLAQALAPRVRVCGVAPGVTLPSGPMTEAEFDAAHKLTPLQRSSTPDDIARAVRFLLESPAITGTTLLVDGGQHLQAQSRDVLYLARPSSEFPVTLR